MYRLFLILILSFFFQAQVSAQTKNTSLYEGRDIDLSEAPSTIAFSSCNNQRKEEEQRIWASVAFNDPDLWIWTGDIIYADTRNMKIMEDFYLTQKNQPYYRTFRQSVPVIGIWDDHDYGVNDGWKSYPRKEESKQLLFDFLDLPKDHPARSRPGAYHSWTFGSGERSIKIILLDGRSFRDKLEPNPLGNTRYLVNTEGDMLGEEQWAWLEEELTQSEARVNLIVSGVQFIPEEQGYEKWANFPAARARFFNLLSSTRPRNPILISGDRHIAEISGIPVKGYDEMVFEITASGMTHTWSDKNKTEPNVYRIGPLVVERNFGLLHIDWDADSPQAVVEIRGPENKLFYQFSIDLE